MKKFKLAVGSSQLAEKRKIQLRTLTVFQASTVNRRPASFGDDFPMLTIVVCSFCRLDHMPTKTKLS
jgi:hypothetical protein